LKNILLDYCGQEATKTTLAIKDNSRNSLYVYTSYCAYLSHNVDCSNKVDFTSMNEAEMAIKRESVLNYRARVPLSPLGAAANWWFGSTVRSDSFIKPWLHVK